MINNARADAVVLERDIEKSVPTIMLPNCKVLPQVNEGYKLRPTTNGVILFSGDTISGKHEQFSTKTITEPTSQMPQPPGLKQRSRTFIHDDSKQVVWKYTQPMQQNSEKSYEHQNYHQSLPAFRRSQTLLHLNDVHTFRCSQTLLHLKSDIVREKNQASKSLCRKMVYASTKAKVFEETLKNTTTFQRHEVDSEQVTSKQLKYNKKRKAPAPYLSAISVPKSPSSPSTDNKYLAGTMANNSNIRVIKVMASPESLLDKKMLLEDLPTRTRTFSLECENSLI